MGKQVALAGLLDARRRQVDDGSTTTVAYGGDRVGVLLDVLVIGVDRGNAEPDGRLDLVGAPAQDRQLDRRGWSSMRAPLTFAFGRDRLQERWQGRAGARSVLAGIAEAASSRLGDQLAAQVVEQAHRHHRPAFDRRVQVGGAGRSSPQPAELGREELEVGGRGFGRCRAARSIATRTRGGRLRQKP